MSERSVRCLLVPLQGMHLLVPNAAVAEILTFQPPNPVPQSPPWLLGVMRWRGRLIPVLSFEAATGAPRPPLGARSRLVVLHNATAEEGGPGHYALVTQGFPSLLTAEAGSLAPLEEEGGGGEPGVRARVLVGGRAAVIPDFDALELLLRDRHGAAAEGG
ncbi:chemotaxis protein CheW [Inmirania thermothiophila]|uniref:Chemosensory pili system protein ChpC n=1 Tax=Inmirania thermothiophila TaxID=1750597 RepID=A0A3N1Y6K2_9GAMM|nr:chemotaxis protein CheW [Inmirania thermothiophila]ROR34171.1 chemosensory pili system protein ChpC [Inmirania thermothiophila]